LLDQSQVDISKDDVFIAMCDQSRHVKIATKDMNNQKLQMLKLESTKLQVLNLVMNVNMEGDLHISNIKESKHDDPNFGTRLSQLDSHGNPCIFVGNLQHLVDLPHFVEYIQQCDGRLDINNWTWAEFVWPPLKLQDVKRKLLKP